MKFISIEIQKTLKNIIVIKKRLNHKNLFPFFYTEKSLILILEFSLLKLFLKKIKFFIYALKKDLDVFFESVLKTRFIKAT